MSLSFLQLGFLAAGAAAMTLPLWIHLLLRQRARPLEIGSTRFIKQVVRRTKRRQRIQRWVLLALRCLCVLLLGLLFARPYLPEVPVDGRTREAVILIDRSASMRVLDSSGTTAFELARRKALDRIDSLGTEAVVKIGLYDSNGVEAIAPAELESALPGWTGTGYEEALAWAADTLDSANREHRSLLVLGDLQRESVNTAMIQFPADVPVDIQNLVPSVAPDVSIDRAVATQVELRPKNPVRIAVRIRNASSFPVAGIPISVELQGPGDDIRLESTVSLDANQQRTMDIALPISESGLYTGTISIDHKDAIEWDNRRFVALEAKHPDRLLLVDGELGRTKYENETYFLETTLRLTTAVGDAPSRTFEVERLVWDRGQGFPDLAGYRLVVLANIGRCSSSDAQRLQQFVNDGGNVLIFAGERTTPSVLQTILDSGLLGTITVAPPKDGFVRVSRIATEHPALASFEDPSHGDLRRLTVERYLPISNLGETTNVLLAGRGVPLIVAHQTGAGHAVLVTTTADNGWNQWSKSRLYVPLMRQLAAWLTGQLKTQMTVVEQAIADAGSKPRIEQQQSLTKFCNVPPSESNPRRYSVSEFRAQWGLLEIEETAIDSEEAAFAPAGLSRSDELWPLVVWILITLLAAELLLASRIHE